MGAIWRAGTESGRILGRVHSPQTGAVSDWKLGRVYGDSAARKHWIRWGNPLVCTRPERDHRRSRTERCRHFQYECELENLGDDTIGPASFDGTQVNNCWT